MHNLIIDFGEKLIMKFQQWINKEGTLIFANIKMFKQAIQDLQQKINQKDVVSQSNVQTSGNRDVIEVRHTVYGTSIVCDDRQTSSIPDNDVTNSNHNNVIDLTITTQPQRPSEQISSTTNIINKHYQYIQHYQYTQHHQYT